MRNVNTLYYLGLQLYYIFKIYSIIEEKYMGRVILFNPLVTDPLYLICIAKISIYKKEGIIEKKFL